MIVPKVAATFEHSSVNAQLPTESFLSEIASGIIPLKTHGTSFIFVRELKNDIQKDSETISQKEERS